MSKGHARPLVQTRHVRHAGHLTVASIAVTVAVLKVVPFRVVHHVVESMKKDKRVVKESLVHVRLFVVFSKKKKQRKKLKMKEEEDEG